jgi:dGTPase
MGNNFYSNFDLQRLNKSTRDTDYRSDFQIDRDRIIHSSEFRRLQGKTQVFLPGESDYYRTRLTHSIEVSQIGRSICNFLFKRYPEYFNDKYYIDSDLVEAACLAHDLGHPPFGHAGERTLNRLMSPYGGFEGNAQTLRLITEVFYRKNNGRRGMNPARAFLDSILKYKCTYSQFNNPENHFIYDFQKTYVAFVFYNNNYYKQFKNNNELNNFRSIECQIMDWADDTAYALNDIVDSISGGFITIKKLLKWLNDNSVLNFEQKIIEEIIQWIEEGIFKAKFGSLVGEFIRGCSIIEKSTFMNTKTNRYKYNLEISKEILSRTMLYKRIALELVFQTTHIQQMEYKGNLMLEQMFRALEDNYITNIKTKKLLPDFTDSLIRNEKNLMKRANLVCDYLSGMTDTFAMRTYKRLFDPDFSSHTDYV